MSYKAEVEMPLRELKKPTHTKHSVHSGRFVDDILDLGAAYSWQKQTPLGLFSLPRNVMESFIRVEDEIHMKTVVQKEASLDEQTEAFNNLVKAFNILWNKPSGEPTTRSEGFFVASWIHPLHQYLYIDQKRFNSFDHYYESHSKLLSEYFGKSRKVDIFSMFHEIDNNEACGVVMMNRSLISGIWQSNMVGLTQVGKGSQAEYGILHRSFETIIS